METIEQVPKTALDVFRLLPDGTLCEVIDNVLYMSPAPNYKHQALVALLARKIGNYLDTCQVGEVIISPFDVYFEELQSAVQPDLLVLLNDNRQILNENGYMYGAPDIIVEVLSADKKRDLVKKKNVYERAGVKEYFVVDPTNNEVTFWALINNKYQQQYIAVGLFRSAILSFQLNF